MYLFSVSTKKEIREMDADELEVEYQRTIAGINGNMMIEYDNLNLIRKCYKQITGTEVSDTLFNNQKNIIK